MFQNYDSNARILVSPHNVTKNWNTSEWDKQPHQLIVDSGAYSVNKSSLSCEDVLNRQLSMTIDWHNKKKLFFSHPDILIPQNCPFTQMNRIISNSLERAMQYIGLIRKKKIKCIPLGVIHGFDEETLLSSYYELKDAGYKHFAIGSLAIRISHSKDLCLKAIKILTDFCVNPLHLFGILWPSHSKGMNQSISSFDSASPAKLGFYGTVLYGPNLNHYVISPNSQQKLRDHFWKFRKSIEKPLPCECPICKSNPLKLNSTNDAQAKTDRTIHNYFQIKWATKQLN